MPSTRKQCAAPKKMEFWKGETYGLRFWSMHITDKTSKDELKKQATYPKGDHTDFKQEYWDHPIRKMRKLWKNWISTTNTILLCWTNVRDWKYSIPDWMYGETFTIFESSCKITCVWYIYFRFLVGHKPPVTGIT